MEVTAQFTTLNSKDVIYGISEDRFQLVDVRTAKEYEAHHIPDSMLIPIQELEKRYVELDSTRETLVICERGVRSQEACSFLSKMGFMKLYNLKGGLCRYEGAQDGKHLFKSKMKNLFWRIFHF